MIGKLYSLRAAAALLGVHRATLKAWLRADLAMRWPEVKRGSKLLIREQDLETIVQRRAPQSDFARRRTLLAALHTSATRRTA